MKLLIMNENLIEGGAEQSCLKMKEIFEQNGEDVYYLTFDSDFERKKKEIKNIKNIININVKKNLINKMLFKPILYLKIRKLLREILPEKIILNNIFCSPITQMKALKGYDVYQIVRDYSIVCPKMTSTKENYEICYGCKKDKCLKCCNYHNSKLQLGLKLLLTKKMEKLRKKIVRKTISPSENLNKYLIDYHYDSICINNPMETNGKILKTKKINEVKTYIYVGTIVDYKGIYHFIDIFNKFSKNKNALLRIIGKCQSEKDKIIIQNYLKDNKKIEYLGYKNHEETIQYITNSDYIVVPSLWIENYPTTSLEGMLCGTVVLGNNRGGIPEILADNRGMLFDVQDGKDTIKVLNESFNLSKVDYENIRIKAFNYVMSNNSYETYYKKIIDILRK